MPPERWKQIEDLYHAALEQEPAVRGAFLAEACGADAELRGEVESLLAQPSNESPLNRPAWEGAEILLQSNAEPLAPGARLGPYRVEAPLGAGGMGEVFHAVDTRLGRSVAIKICRARFNERFEREARAISALAHPNICTLYDVGATPSGAGFLVMELVQGQTLSVRLAAGSMPVEQVRRVGAQLAGALAHAHAHGIIHRDLKSANVIITPEGQAKLLDFGLAKRLSGELTGDDSVRAQDSLTGPGAVIGTPAYLAPEQLRGQPADARSDIWALGVVLYEMASGVRPFQGRTVFELVSAILNQPPPPLPSLPGPAPPAWLPGVIERCLAKDPAQRYQHSEEVRAALEDVKPGGNVNGWLTGMQALPRRRWLALAVASPVVLAAVALLDVGGVRHRVLGGAAGPRYRSLAVLPVTNLSGDPGQEYFTDGMTDALIADLSKIGALKVISRTSVMQYKEAKKPLPQIARDLKVDTVLEASVMREGGRVRVTAQLIEAATDQHLWAETYERDMTSILALQSEVAQAVAKAINIRLRPQEETRLARARKVNPATYEAYLRGMYYLDKSTPESLQKGMAYLHEAVANDPADPLANAGLALGYIEMAHGADPTDDALLRAKAAALTALRLDDTLAETLAVSGCVKGYYEWHWEDAERDMRRALDVNPSLAIAHYHRAWFLALFDRIAEAIEEHKRARDLDPFNLLYTAWLGELYRMDRRYNEALIETRKSIEMDPKFPPGHYIQGLIFKDKGMYDQAIAELQTAAKADPDWRWTLGPMYASAGHKDEARKVLAELQRQEVIPWVAFWLAENYMALGKKDETFRWLNYQHQHVWLPWLRVLSWYDDPAGVRRDPRFQALLRRMNLPPIAP